MKPLDEIKYRKFKRRLSMVLDIIGLVVGALVGHFVFNDFGDSYFKLLLCCLVFVVIAEVIRVIVQIVIEKTPSLRAKFETDEPVKKSGKKK